MNLHVPPVHQKRLRERQELDGRTEDLMGLVLKIREEVRSMGRSKDFVKGDLFGLTDRIRDVYLSDLGITLQDGTEGEPTKFLLS